MVPRSLRRWAAVAGVAGALVAVPLFATAALAADPTYDGTAVKTITADLKDGNGAIIGAVQMSQDAKGVIQLTVSGNGLAAGDHGIHIHATGKCEGPAFTSANAHINLTNHQHGLDNPAGPHEGDLPGLTAAANGTYTYTATTNRVSITGGATNIFDADGSALVVHATKDDQVTDPTGNSGGRVACAVIAPGAAPLPPGTGTSPADGGSPLVLFAAFAVITGALAMGGYRLASSRKQA